MSLDAIRTMRRAGQKPAVVMVVIGERPSLVDDDAGVVFIRPGDQPAGMDWRPLVGVLVAVFTLQPLPALTIAVLDALQAAGARLFGAADTTGVYAVVDETGAGERLMQRSWRLLCQS